MAEQSTKRCAIYTRKSSEEGLDKEFNSLEAQRESGEIKILSQKHAGWELIPDHYDDGGISGGTMERPALQRLLEDIKSGKVDIVVVYKIDRLSRSMFDFLGMIKFFDEHNVSFVSVTQDLNTDTAMGRLVLNVLQSFAQFEREIASERIKDKIALSKKKGMWMGGTVPIGYDAIEGKLEVNEDEAKIVQLIFSQFTATASATAVVKHLKQKGYKTKGRTSRRGKHYPPKNFSKSALYQILNNKTYIGKIEHKEQNQIYEGLHAPIIDMKLWNRAHEILKTNIVDRRRITSDDRPYLLKGILEDPDGYSMTPTFTRKKDNRIYRYYISTQATKHGYEVCPLKTISAPLLEEVVLGYVRRILTNTEWLNHITKADENEPPVSLPDIKAMMQNFDTMWPQLFPAEQARIVQLLIHKVTIFPAKLVIVFHPPGLASVLQDLLPELTFKDDEEPDMHKPMVLEIPINFKKRHRRKMITSPDGRDLISNQNANFDEALIKGITRAHKWQEMIDSGKARSIRDVAEREGVPSGYACKIIRLTELAPDITTAIINGRQPQSLQLASMMDDFPILWADQRQHFGF